MHCASEERNSQIKTALKLFFSEPTRNGIPSVLTESNPECKAIHDELLPHELRHIFKFR
jgi:hypothetical protein